MGETVASKEDPVLRNSNIFHLDKEGRVSNDLYVQ